MMPARPAAFDQAELDHAAGDGANRGRAGGDDKESNGAGEGLSRPTKAPAGNHPVSVGHHQPGCGRDSSS